MTNDPYQMRRMWLGCVGFVVLLLLGICGWFTIEPADLHSQINRYLVVPVIIAFAAVGLIVVLLLYGNGCPNADVA
jgi:hypothetical protein